MRVRAEEFRQVLRVAGAEGKLVGVNDGQRVEFKAIRSKAHAVDGELVQPSPGHLPRRGMDEQLSTLREKPISNQRGALAPVIENNLRLRSEVLQVVHEIHNAFRVLVHQEDENVMESS